MIAGARTPNGAFLNTVEGITNGVIAAQMKAAALGALKDSSGKNTTIGCVMTNAKLDKTYANKLAAISHDGFAMSIRPVHTDADGDTMFALSKGDKAIDFSIVAALAAEATAFAIENAVSAK